MFKDFLTWNNWRYISELPGNNSPESLDLLDINFRYFPDSLNGLDIPGNNWFCGFAVTYVRYRYD